jgi:hypothetical protein
MPATPRWPGSGAALAMIAALVAGCSDSRHDRGPTLDTTPPTVTATEPAAGATDVPVVTRVQATFSEAMRAATITETTVRVAAAGRPDELGVVTYDAASHVATFTPLVPWPPFTTITATVTTGVRDLWGNAMQADHVWTFTTGQIPDTTAPTVTATDPPDGATNVWRNRAVTATFSEPMRVETITDGAFTLSADGASPIAGTVVYIGGSAVFHPAENLPADTAFTAVVHGSVQDLAGNAMGTDHVWRFTTGTLPDTTAPWVVSTRPCDGATDVPRNATISATFSEAMDPATLTTATVTTFTLIGPDRLPVAGTVRYDTAGFVATFAPAGLLEANTAYLARVTTGATDLAGNPLAADHEWGFRTGTRIRQKPPELESVASFALFAAWAVENCGASVIDGNVGVSPGCRVAGFPPGVVNGSIHAGDDVAARARSDLTAAWLDLRGRTLGVEPLPPNLAGRRFLPGLYRSEGTVVVGTWDWNDEPDSDADDDPELRVACEPDDGAEPVVTLDAAGDPDAVFVFQIAGSLGAARGARVALVGGARAANVFWQVDRGAAFGRGTAWAGSVLARRSVALGERGRADGRLLTWCGVVATQEVAVAVPGR